MLRLAALLHDLGRLSVPNGIWARPGPGARKPRFSREQIAAAALAIADTEGFDAVSIRRVAAELGAGTMSLYRYISAKADLVALMDDAIMGESLVPDGQLPAGAYGTLTVSSDGSYTYFASDIAYHKSKVERGFRNLIDVWGADHGG